MHHYFGHSRTSVGLYTVADVTLLVVGCGVFATCEAATVTPRSRNPTPPLPSTSEKMLIIAEENEIASIVIEPEVAAALAEVKAVAHAQYEIADDTFIDYTLALAIANKFDAEPLWGFLVGPPSSLKSQLLMALEGCPWVEFMSTLTPQTLASGWEDKKGKNQSLLFTLDKKTLVIKDFTTILQMRTEHRAEVFSHLREMYDRKFDKKYGTGRPVKWDGKVGLIAAVTPEIERHTAVNQALGERFLYYRMGMNNPRSVAKVARRNAIRATNKRKSIGGAVLEFLSLFGADEIDPSQYVGDVMGDKMDTLSEFCAVARTPVVRDYRNRDHIEVAPCSEGTGRISEQLTILGFALATIRGINGINEEVYLVLKKTVLDMIPPRRLLVMRFLLDKQINTPEQSYGIDVVGVRTGIPSMTCRYVLDDLFMLGLVEKSLDTSKNKFLFKAHVDLIIYATICDILSS